MVKKWAIRLLLAGLSVVALNVLSNFFYPDVSMLRTVNPKRTAFMEYREDQWKRQNKKKKIIQQWVSLSQISPFVVKAVIIAEDDKFWSHEGFDVDAIKKALEKDLKQRKFKFGGSTISQQLAKNLFLSPSKNPIRKLKEAILTWRIERSLSKRRIIELYLNVAEWGDGLFGIEAASRHYYGRPASDLSAVEAAKLATVLPNPNRYRPEGGGRYVEARSELIYQIMVRRGIVIEEYDDAMEGPAEAVGTQGGAPRAQGPPEAAGSASAPADGSRKPSPPVRHMPPSEQNNPPAGYRN
jgi:monofunctional biosynthetic peptidoglycan transglycosylase